MELLAAVFLFLQDEASLARKCDSQIPWISDKLELTDNAQPGQVPPEKKVDRAALLARAKKAAAERKRLVLWYCFRVPGPHMYRGRLPDTYMRAAVFTDPGVVELVRAKFVPLRMACDAALGAELGVKAFDFVEPGFIFLTPEGKVVHKIDRVRTFNAAWVRAALVAVLRKNETYNAPAGESFEELLAGGDDERALAKAPAGLKSFALRRAGLYADAAGAEGPALQKGLALFSLGRLDEARRELEKDASPESLYHQAAIDSWSGKSPGPRWKALAADHPDSPWAWRAAANLAPGPDSLPDGPGAHLFEDFFAPLPDGPPARTLRPSRDFDAAARGAVEFLLRAQGPAGGWEDSRYCYWPSKKILPNVWMAVTALSALALSEWREADPARIDAALARAEEYLSDETRMRRGENEECYADAYRLLYLARKKDVRRMNAVVTYLASQQKDGGHWAHEYPNPFASAAVVHSLHAARQAGANVPADAFRRAAEGLKRTRGAGGTQSYEDGQSPATEKNSAARIAPCELALFECGAGTRENVAAALDKYWKFVDRLEAVRSCDYHSDGQLAGFFFFNGVFHSVEAARALDEPRRKEHLARFRAQVLALPEIDGSFLDSHELGKSYGTAAALLILSRTRER